MADAETTNDGSNVVAAARLAAALLAAVSSDGTASNTSTVAGQDLYAAGGAVGYGPFAEALPDMADTEFGGGYGVVQMHTDHVGNLTASEVSGVMRRAGMAGAHVSLQSVLEGTVDDIDPVTGLSVADVTVGQGHD